MTQNNRKILIVRVGRVGDIVMITAAVNAILDLYPDAEIHVLTSQDGKRVLKSFHKNITEFYIYDRSKLLSFLQRRRLKQIIKKNHYTDVYCFEMNPSYLSLLDGDESNIYTLDDYDEGDNYAKQCMKLVAKPFSRDDYNQWVYLSVADDKLVKAKAILAEQGIVDQDFVIALHPSFSGLQKNPFRSQQVRQERGWPLEYFAELARKYHSYGSTNGVSIKVITDLLDVEKGLGEQLVRKSDGIVKLFTPPMDFERYKGTLKRADLVITPNTGPMHIAAALGSPVISLFAGLKPQNSGAYVPPENFVAICAEDMPESASGLSAISPQVVFDASLAFLPKP